MSHSEQAIEQEIQDKGLNAPRLKPEDIDAKIKAIRYLTGDVAPVYTHEDYFADEDKGTACLTICILTLENGFTVTGESACASPENFDKLIGQQIAYNNAREKIWMLEGYLLKQRLHTALIVPSEEDRNAIVAAKIQPEDEEPTGFVESL